MADIANIIRTEQDTDGMLRRALERIIQLYTDKSHFIYELLQNAEDAEAHSIKFIQYSDRLEVFHDGKPFTKENLQGLCDIGKSDKSDNLNQIGEFGVGFKSVFGICEDVKLYSAPSNFRIQPDQGVVPFAVEIKDFIKPVDIPEEKMDSSYTTRFVFPYKVGESFSGFSDIDALNVAVSKKLQNLGITTLLFMKNLELISYQIELDNNTVQGEYLLEKQEINDHCSIVSAIGSSGNGSEKVLSYLKFSRFIDEKKIRTVDIAFPISIDEKGNYKCEKTKNPHISVYFPTETESKLDFIVQGPYRTTPNRSSIPSDNIDNIRLAKETAILLRDSILELVDLKKFNMTFVKCLPLKEDKFYAYNLFLPLYYEIKDMFNKFAITPTLTGGYQKAKNTLIARQEKLTTLLNDNSLTTLINDGINHYWLPTFLTETNKEYEPVYRFFYGELRVKVVRPEDLQWFFEENKDFLPLQSNDWLVDLYNMLENVGAAFSKTKYGANMLVANIIKTSKGDFVAPYRKTDNGSYIPNVFLPSPNINSDDIYFVDETLYARCKHFFDDILQLQKPNEYEYFLQQIKKSYSLNSKIDDKQHINHVKFVLKYSKYDEYKEEVDNIKRNYLKLRCIDGKMYNAFDNRVFLSKSRNGLDIEGYFRNIVKTVVFVDRDFYKENGFNDEHLISLGVQDDIVLDEDDVFDYSEDLSIEGIKNALLYISQHPTAKDSIIKSVTIMKVLFLKESSLCETGFDYSSKTVSTDYCELIKILLNEKIPFGWDGKWLYDSSNTLTSSKDISKYDLNSDLYGSVKESRVYELLRFKKTEADEVDDLETTIGEDKLSIYVDHYLSKRYGLSVKDFDDLFGDNPINTSEKDNEPLGFPSVPVKSWEALKKHVAEMLLYSDPTKYDYILRRIRTSNRPRDIRAYLMNMYRYVGTNKYACQMCHEECSNPEYAELFLTPKKELDPMNICLCPNCHARYKRYRNNTYTMLDMETAIRSLSEEEIKNSDPVVIPINNSNDEIWFTQTHFVEIRELLKLQIEAEKPKTPMIESDDENENSGTAVYQGYIGKRIVRQKNVIGGEFEGTIISIDDDYIKVKITKGPKSGQETSFKTEYIISHRNSQYEIID